MNRVKSYNGSNSVTYSACNEFRSEYNYEDLGAREMKGKAKRIELFAQPTLSLCRATKNAD